MLSARIYVGRVTTALPDLSVLRRTSLVAKTLHACLVDFVLPCELLQSPSFLIQLPDPHRTPPLSQKAENL